MECSFEGCSREARSKGAQTKGLCFAHYKQSLKGKVLSPLRSRVTRTANKCRLCQKQYYAKGLCRNCYYRQKNQEKRGKSILQSPEKTKSWLLQRINELEQENKALKKMLGITNYEPNCRCSFCAR